jgi:hypothetical protein
MWSSEYEFSCKCITARLSKPWRGLIWITTNEIRGQWNKQHKQLRSSWITDTECGFMNVECGIWIQLNEGCYSLKVLLALRPIAIELRSATEQRQASEYESNDYPLLRKMPSAWLGVDFRMMDVEFSVIARNEAISISYFSQLYIRSMCALAWPKQG